MKVLILCDLFPPAFGPRMGYLCKYMMQTGWEPVVVTEKTGDDGFGFLSELVPNVKRVNYYHFNNKVLRRAEWFLVMLLDLCFHYKNRKMVSVTEKELKKGGFGAVLCSTYRTFPLSVAAEVSQKYDLPFVADLRDIIEQFAGNEYISHPIHIIPCIDKLIVSYIRKHLLKERNEVLRQANYVSTVSPWHVEILKKYNPHINLIYNGFDPEIFFPAHHPTKRFILSYTGRLVSLETRDPKPLFEALQKLDNEELISPESVRVEWYTDSASERLIQEETHKYRLEKYMDYKGYIKADEIPSVLNNSSILLQLANKADEHGPKGIMSTKLFEAMAVEKPLLCVRSDESFLEQLISKTRTGSSARTAKQAYDFILNQFNIWKKEGFTSNRNVDKALVSYFSRKSQAIQFMQLLTEISKRK